MIMEYKDSLVTTQDCEFEEPGMVFDEAIQSGFLSDNPELPNFAGNFMYMFSRGLTVYFKHIISRQYASYSRSPKTQSQ